VVPDFVEPDLQRTLTPAYLDLIKAVMAEKEILLGHDSEDQLTDERQGASMAATLRCDRCWQRTAE
jgi:hypothetical protein